jgi:hypothetical protein
MSVVTCRETFPRRSTTYRGLSGSGRIVRHYHVKTNSLSDDATTIFNAGLLPAFGARHPGNNNVFCDGYNFDQKDDSGFLWDVTVEYISLSGGGLPEFERLEFTEPVQRTADISWDSVKFRKPVLRADYLSDLRGSVIAADVPITNSAGVPYNPPAEIDDSRPQVTIVKNVIASPPWLILYQDAVNNDSFTVDGVSVEPYQAKVESVRVGPVRLESFFTSFFAYRQLTLVIQFQREGWDLALLDAGFSECIESQDPGAPPPIAAKRRNILDSENVVIREPALLDRRGQKLEEGAPAEYRDFRVYTNLRPFSGLPLQ